MTIAALDKELKSVVDHYSVYGVECILSSLIRACRDKRYLEPDVIKHILDHVIAREEKIVIAHDNSSIYPDIYGIHYYGGDHYEVK